MTSLERLLGDQLLCPGHRGWDSELAGFNTAAVHRPDLVVAAEHPDHVATAVRYAADHDLPVGVQVTGHGISVPADRGILITTGRLRGVSIDPAARTARVEAGVRWNQVIAAALPYGLGSTERVVAVCGGPSVTPSVAVSGRWRGSSGTALTT